ncbi:MAG TPA: class I SAM-dependent methyltransferase [Candidatus Glassbacteria bacterium]|nr:class I SAM-dependent methyltransferase [Candidatus Glassbacteria bacterium]
MKGGSAENQSPDINRIKRRRYASEDFGESYDERYAGGVNLVNTAVERAWTATHLAGEPLLDAGAGTGRIAAWLTGRGAPVFPLDSSFNMLAHLKGKVPGLPATAGDLYRLPFGDGCFGAVICLHVLFHLPDWPAALAELARVLKPGGSLIFEIRSGEHVRLAKKILLSGVTRPEEAGPGDPATATIYATRPEVRRALADTGLSLEKTLAYDIGHSYWFRPLAGLAERALKASGLVRRLWAALELGAGRWTPASLLYRTLYLCRKDDLSR